MRFPFLRYFTVVEGLRPDVMVTGWSMEDPFTFDNRAAAALIAESARSRPVYLASLSEEYYRISELENSFCIVEEGNLYRVLPIGMSEMKRCTAIDER